MPTVTWRGNPVTTQGPELKVGDKAPAGFTVTATDMSAVKGADLAGKNRIVLSSPSIDTPVCDIEARKFNEEATAIPGVQLAFVTVDLPFAQKRWCAGANIDKLKMLSDYKDRSFGTAYGVLEPSRQLHARAVFVIDASDTVRHVEYVKEVTTEPDYAAALEAAKALK
jgi:thioredoxin-dependent peroxiredoxin